VSERSERQQEDWTSSAVPTQLRRENPDPHEARNPLPPLFLAFFGAISAFGFMYLLRYGGRDLSAGGDKRSPQTLASARVTGESLFQARCAACHQLTGVGVPRTFPPLVGSPWLLQDRQTPIRIVLLGLQGGIEVRGESYAGVMPRFADQLSDTEIALILSHERSTWGNTADAVTAEDVQRVRASLEGRTDSWNGGAELSALRTEESR
jgi:mono/diheme cytochrome c family protein